MDLTIRQINEKISNGEIRIPSFQRGFIWEPDAVALLIDSIFKGFPIGTVVLWNTSERLNVEKRLGNFNLPEPKKSYPINYVLDGQQRLTSIFSVFQVELTPIADDEWLDIYYLLDSSNVVQKSRFVALKKEDVIKDKHFPLSVLFDPVKYRHATEELPDKIISDLDEMSMKFKEVKIPYEEFRTDDKDAVAIIFERINRTGKPLDSFQLLTAWGWSADFDLQEEFNNLAEDLEEFGFRDLIDNQNLILKCFTGYILNDTSPAAILMLEGDKIRKNFEEIKSGIKSSIDFLQKELKIYSLDMMPYPTMLIVLTKFFASKKVNGESFSDKQRAEIIKWFWRSCFSRRYSSGVNNALETDLNSINKLRDDENVSISDFKCEISAAFFTNNRFRINTVNTKIFISMLAQNNPKSFISGANVDLSNTLNKASSKEFHHIFPDKYLQRLGKNRDDIFALANFCFLNNADNQKIKDKSPKDYMKLINIERLYEFMEAAICPSNSLELEFETFISERNKLLINYANQLIK